MTVEILPNRNNALLNAFVKIQTYCQKYEGKTNKDVQVNVYTDTYIWVEFGVTPAGQAYLVRGNHANSRRSKDANWYGHPEHPAGYVGALYDSIEKLLCNWEKVKSNIDKEFDFEYNIFHFEP